jgi:hypothetical protein
MSRSNHVTTGSTRRNARKAEAITRSARRDQRSNDEQIAVLKTRPGNSKRELARLSA